MRSSSLSIRFGRDTESTEADRDTLCTEPSSTIFLFLSSEIKKKEVIKKEVIEISLLCSEGSRGDAIY
jgi:hypothetical protein